MTDIKTLGVIGAGAWGTALAHVFAQKDAQVSLWAHDAANAGVINNTRVNEKYLPDIVLSDNVTATGDLKTACACDAVILVVPTQYMAGIVEKAAKFIKAGAPILIASKGIDITSLRLLSQIVSGALPDNPVGVLTGPNLAREIAQNLPAAMTLAMPAQHSDLAYNLCEILSTPHLRIYAGDDIIGAQIGGAIKNVIAIACGIAEGKHMGDNARAAIVTRGMAEMVRLGTALGADAETFLGLSGIGDLTLTCNAIQSRNFSLGVAIGQGRRAADILAERASVAEGYYTAEAAVKLAEKMGVDMPICHAVYETLHKEKAVDYVIKGLLMRPVRAE